MSTNYYFVSKEELKNEKKFDKFIEKLDVIIEKKCNKFLETIDDSRFEDILYDFQKEYKNQLTYAYEPERIHICKTSGGDIKFQSNDFYGNIAEMEKFYNDNKDSYIIQNEYGEKFTWKGLLKHIGYSPKSSYKWINSYFS